MHPLWRAVAGRNGHSTNGFDIKIKKIQRSFPVNGLLWSLPQLLSGGLHCLPVLAEEANRMQLFLRVQNWEDAASIGLFYAFERISWEAGKLRKIGGINMFFEDKVQCGICSKAQFLDAFCTANFGYSKL